MASPPNDIRIPRDLLPKDGRFGSGPSKIRRAQVEALQVTVKATLTISPAVRLTVREVPSATAQLAESPPSVTVCWPAMTSVRRRVAFGPSGCAVPPAICTR